jgi:hypothetical protein
MTPIELAKQWRQETGRDGRGGVVILFEGAVAGWMDELRNPNHWQPGCVAVDEDDRTWTAIAGNDQDGALMWLPSHDV